MLLLCSFAFFCASLAAAGRIPVQPECSLGPKFWCEDFGKAVQCGAVQHCMSTVWSDHKENENICTECSQMFQLLMDVLESKEAVDHIEETLKSACWQLSSASLATTCFSFMETSLPGSISFFQQHVKPDSACATIGLCKSENPGIENSELLTNDIFDSAVPTATGSTKLQPLCTLCIFLLNRLESLIPKKRAEDTIIKFLNKVCSSMPRYTAQCKIFVTTYGKVAVDFLLSSMAPQTICTLLRLCFIQQTGLLQVNSESDCALCHSLVPSLQVSLSDNATALETEATLSSACYSHQLPLPTCKNFVQTYSPKLVKVTGKKWDFQTVCKEIEACSEADITPHLENSECTWGPTYWCLDLQTAKQCNAVEHCQSHVWK